MNASFANSVQSRALLAIVLLLGACSSAADAPPAPYVDTFTCNGSPDAGMRTVDCEFQSRAPEGPFTSPGDFGPGPCLAPALDPDDMLGTWRDDGGLLWRFSECGKFLEAQGMEFTSTTDEGVVMGNSWRRVYLCETDGPDLIGQQVYCFGGEGMSCMSPSDIRLSPYGRIPDEIESEGFEFVAEYSQPTWSPSRAAGDGLSGIASNVEVSDGYAYVTIMGVGLRIVDVSDPSRPSEVGHYDSCEVFNDITLFDVDESRYAVIATENGALVLDLSTPHLPLAVGRILTPTHRLDLAVVDDIPYLFIGGAIDEVNIYNLSEPSAPTLVGTLSVTGSVHAVTYYEGTLYVNAGRHGLQIINAPLPDPESAVAVGVYNHSFDQFSHHTAIMEVGNRRIAVTNDELGPKPWIHIVDATPGAENFAESISEFKTRPNSNSHNVQVSGNIAFIAYYRDGIRALDLRTPETPVQVGHFNSWDPDNGPLSFSGAFDVDFDAETGLLYVADYPRGLLILRPTFPMR